MNFTELYTIVLTKPDQDGVSGTFGLDLEPGSTLLHTASTTSPTLTTKAPASSATPTSTPAPTTKAPASTNDYIIATSPLDNPWRNNTDPLDDPCAPFIYPFHYLNNPGFAYHHPSSQNCQCRVDLTPNPPQAGQPLTIFGDAVASSGPAPTGNVTVYVDGVPVATAPVVPLRGGRRSLFSVTIAAPSSRGAHTIVVVFSPSSSGEGGNAVAVTIQVTVVGAAATVNLVLSTSSLLFPSCLKPLEAVAWVSGASGSTAPTGTVTLGISGGSFAALGATLNSSVLGTAPIVASVATFDIRFSGPLKSAADTLKEGSGSGSDAELLPGSYQLTACYSGDIIYCPACGSAPITVGPKCSQFSLTMNDAHS
ncbi:g6960 [Coccomyxa elongata]